ncbi:hypothetical protein NDU88_007211 [Pleurodeles waltl]|uniref:Uncharacterized protein n=1 Tax=Pleurodeles waltl TaxID=8319 RepID=A0AAV7UN71_PLEWA|nr:hypothetical protein NDU88_007211 [Pleurodeles waltl]
MGGLPAHPPRISNAASPIRATQDAERSERSCSLMPRIAFLFRFVPPRLEAARMAALGANPRAQERHKRAAFLLEQYALSTDNGGRKAELKLASNLGYWTWRRRVH